MLCFMCKRGPATHYRRAITGPVLLPVCGNCSWVFEAKPLPTPRLRPLTPAWQMWMRGRARSTGSEGSGNAA